MKYLIHFQVVLEVEAENENEAKKKSSEQFEKLEEKGYKVENAKVADKNSGYFI